MQWSSKGGICEQSHRNHRRRNPRQLRRRPRDRGWKRRDARRAQSRDRRRDRADSDIDRSMTRARAAFEGKAWGGMDVRARARLVNRLADAFEANLDALYRLETLNNGRAVNATRAPLSRLPGFFRHF